MATFTFVGHDPEGHKLSGARKFTAKSQMEAWLDSAKVQNYQIFESKTRYKNRPYANTTPKQLSIFCKEMSVLFFSHITLMEGLLLISTQTENKQLKLALVEIRDHMSNGYTFAESMNMYNHIFSPYLLNMITIGEQSGTLDTIFQRMSDYFEKEHKLRKKLRSALTYPAILTALMAAIVLLLIIQILPMFSSILNEMGGEMPSVTKAILGAGEFLVDYGVIILAVLAAIVICFLLFIRTNGGKIWFDKMKLHIPISRHINSRVITSRFGRSLSILLRSGVQLLNAFEDVTDLIENKYLEAKFAAAFAKIKGGEELANVLNELGVFPALFIRLLTIGQSTGHLDEMLEKSANIFEEEVDDAIEKLTLMLEPILIIILSVIVGIILLSVMLPMISIMNSIA